MTTTASSPSRPSSLPACGPHLPHQRLSRSRQTTNKPSPTCFQLPTPSPGQLTTTMITRSAAAAAVSSESSQTPQTQAGSATTSRKQAAINLLATGLPDSQLQMLQPNSYLPPTQIHFTSAILSSSLKFGTHTCTHHHHHHHHRPHILTNKQN